VCSSLRAEWRRRRLCGDADGEAARSDSRG
jgi:hypothetical protein